MACSGGSDSVALLAALGRLRGEAVAGHVVHDFRPRERAMGDCEHVRGLAERLGVEFACAEVAVREGRGNAEARGRSARYAALATMARAYGCGWVATAHHAEDQLETMLLRLMRGAGAAGLAGIRERTRLADFAVIRPMLGLMRAEGEAICRGAGVTWRQDETNADTARDRSWLRHEVLPKLLERWPKGATRAAQAARLLADVDRRLTREGARLSVRARRGDSCWDRGVLCVAPGDVLGAWLRMEAAARGVPQGRMPARRMEAALAAFGAQANRRRTLTLGEVRVMIDATHVRMEGGR